MSRRLFAVMLASVPGLARAQELDADTFDLSGSAFDRQGTLELVHPHLGMTGSFYVGAGVVYSHQPLVWKFADGTEEVVVDGQLSSRLAGGVNVLGAIRVDLEVPVYPWVGVGGSPLFALGDIRLSANIPVVKYEDEGIGVSISPYASIPTASAGTFVSDRQFGGGAIAAAGGKAGPVRYAVNVGADLGPDVSYNGVTMGSNVTAGGGLGFDITEAFLMGVEVTSAFDLAQGNAWNESPVEGHLYATLGTDSGVSATLAGGTGLVPGVGAPLFRGVLLVGFRAPGKPIVHDQDGDGLEDEVDQCVTAAEDFDKWADSDGCPEPDNDKDEIVDGMDQCPNEAEDFDKFSDDDGCPDPDNDKDGIVDDADRCPNVKGSEEFQGCPDRDGDHIQDSEDACPDEPGPENTQGCPDRDEDKVPDSRDKCPDVPADPRIDPRRSDGCPARVIVTKTAIQILDKIYFDTNKTTIKKVSYSLLDEIASVIATNPDIKLIEVSGHTDSVGNDAANLKLSQGRAEAVVKYLTTTGGIDPARLVAKGYGETKPVDTNDTDAGRALNRRVEFNILEQ